MQVSSNVYDSPQTLICYICMHHHESEKEKEISWNVWSDQNDLCMLIGLKWLKKKIKQDKLTVEILHRISNDFFI